jgi:hypothetical protein
MALHLMGAVPKWREEASDQRKRVMPTCALGGSRLSPATTATLSAAACSTAGTNRPARKARRACRRALSIDPLAGHSAQMWRPGGGECATPQREQGAAHILLAHPDPAGDRGRVEWLAAGDLASLVELLDAL